MTSDGWLRRAVVSDDGVYRYRLERFGIGAGDRDRDAVAWIMLNPSTADAYVDDPTIRRIVQFTKRWGHGRAIVVNLFAFRTPSPDRIPRDVARAVGPDNDGHVFAALREAGLAVAAWGSPGQRWLSEMVGGRWREVGRLAQEAGRSLHAIGVTKDGAPKHPLARGAHRVPDDVTPTPWVWP